MSHMLNVCRRKICPAGFTCGQKTLKYYSSGDMSHMLHSFDSRHSTKPIMCTGYFCICYGVKVHTNKHRMESSSKAQQRTVYQFLTLSLCMCVCAKTVFQSATCAGWFETHYTVSDGHKFTAPLLLQLPKCWNYRQEPPDFEMHFYCRGMM